ncbi:MAG: TetR family transcriptional regulator [Candidatus Limnocylindrales bacterium]|jgi:AcrR family transcriptional regulator
MSESSAIDKPGLRERKKARTRASIQEHALRLFREQGYEATTVEQIAEAAEVSPSTFFRYFPTKEDVVAYDALDPAVMASWRSQPPEMAPIPAIRRAMIEVFGSLTPDQVAEMMDRGRLLFSVPELRQAAINEMIRSGQMVADEMAVRLGRPPDDFELRVFAGAVMGGLLAALIPMLESGSVDMMTQLDRAFAFLEKGMPL